MCVFCTPVISCNVFYDLLGMMFTGVFSQLIWLCLIDLLCCLCSLSPFTFSLLPFYCHFYWFTLKQRNPSVVFLVIAYFSDCHSLFGTSAPAWLFVLVFSGRNVGFRHFPKTLLAFLLLIFLLSTPLGSQPFDTVFFVCFAISKPQGHETSRSYGRCL